ncbi:MAG: heme exporter protein CcmD [Burkholderiales bacterium]|nr:heme exporter protein CcmD [Burkholderiales bacterium]
MKWQSLGDFLAMGGYALYVWGSYAVTVAVVALELALLRARAKAARRAAASAAPEDREAE